jgi:TolA-binding protein
MSPANPKQNEITMPTALWEKLNEMSGQMGALDAKIESCTMGIEKAVEYQTKQNGQLTSALQEIQRVKEIATSSATSVAATAAAAASAASAASTAAEEIANLKLNAANVAGERKGISLAWGVGIAVAGLVLTNGLMIFHVFGK